MLKAIVAGAAGRMGKRITALILQNPDIEMAAAFEHRQHPAVGLDAGQVAGVDRLDVPVSDSFEAVIGEGDVLIDFTTPDCTMEEMRLASQRGIPAVIGTTGLTKAMEEELHSLAGAIPCVWAPNMSMGVNVMFKIAAEMARILGEDFDMEILETHHRFKKDAPSGTAMKLARLLAGAVNRDLDEVGVFERKGMTGERTREEIGIQTWRAGDITGEHTVLFGGIGERLELIHRAHNRDNFARGAIRAALWVSNQPKGLYDMQDVLGLK